MKKLLYISFIFIAAFLIGCGSGMQSIQYTHHPYPAFQQLDYYGEWLNIPGLGSVWRPYNENNWQPYLNGNWEWTDRGWMWMSSEPYGWIVYHYGYWDYVNSQQWVWIPGYQWEPSRVRWFHSGGYIGWTPLAPPGVSQSVRYNRYSHRNFWIIVPDKHFVNDNARRYRTRAQNTTINTLRNNSGERGPDIRRIERITGNRIEPTRTTKEQVHSGNRQLIRIKVREHNGVQNGVNRNQSPRTRNNRNRREIRNNNSHENNSSNKQRARQNRNAQRNNRSHRNSRNGSLRNSEGGRGQNSGRHSAHNNHGHQTKRGQVNKREPARHQPRRNNNGRNNGRDTSRTTRHIR